LIIINDDDVPNWILDALVCSLKRLPNIFILLMWRMLIGENLFR